MEENLEQIAKNVLGFTTLKTRMMDSLDFKDVSVWAVKEALELAYLEGQKSKTNT